MPKTREDSTYPGVLFRTFLISDIRGYSTFTRERGDEIAARLASKFADLARDAVEARGGRVIELRGDEALAVFDSTPQAVRAGLEFQEACREATSEDPELPLPAGIGVDCGEAIPARAWRSSPALAGNPRLFRTSPDVPRPACHAGGRGFESRRSRKRPANQHMCLT